MHAFPNPLARAPARRWRVRRHKTAHTSPVARFGMQDQMCRTTRHMLTRRAHTTRRPAQWANQQLVRRAHAPHTASHISQRMHKRNRHVGGPLGPPRGAPRGPPEGPGGAARPPQRGPAAPRALPGPHGSGCDPPRRVSHGPPSAAEVARHAQDAASLQQAVGMRQRRRRRVGVAARRFREGGRLPEREPASRGLRAAHPSAPRGRGGPTSSQPGR